MQLFTEGSFNALDHPYVGFLVFDGVDKPIDGVSFRFRPTRILCEGVQTLIS